MALEMFLWYKPIGRRSFAISAEFAAQSKPLAPNQGPYNGFLVAGLVWGMTFGECGIDVKIFFLGCVLTAACSHA